MEITLSSKFQMKRLFRESVSYSFKISAFLALERCLDARLSISKIKGLGGNF
tara:strand:- start:189 stop:344 length:156 start_codon:yes stop_codon:yes gene_type:complete